LRRKGHPFELVIQPMGVTLPVRDPERTKAVSVAAGRAHTIILTNDGDVFSMGNNAHGQCGRTVIENEQYFGSQACTTD
jgi:alpha-tubulin suppressor-like RCC1 family protein